MTENKDILSNLIKNQRQNLNLNKKLAFTDLKRISYNLPNDIFGNECCIWNGYITNLNSTKKKCYISFFFKNKKIALHRLLYINYIGELDENEYLKYTCSNKGKCCCINHLKKNINTDDTKNKDEKNNDEIYDEKDEKISEIDNKNRVIF